jgi:capsular exopolysaccharide synthesis family protein
MNRDVALTPGDKRWAVQPYDPPVANYRHDPVLTLNLVTILKIMREWRWLILAAVALGVAFGILVTLITTPMYRAWVILQVNPPTVEIMDEKSGDRSQIDTPWDFVATQVGLLSSNSLAQRVAQDLNLANKPDFVDPDASAGLRLREATNKVASGLKVIAPDQGQLIKFSYDADSPKTAAEVANGIAEAFINTNLERRYESSAYARNFLQKQIGKTRRELERSESELVRYAQSQGIINTATDQNATALSTDANSPVGQSLSATNQALADATARRVAAEGAYRAAIGSGVTTAETTSTQVLRQSRAELQAKYQEMRATMKPEHPQMVSLRSQIAELDRQIKSENSAVQQARISGLRSDYEGALAAERSLGAKVAQLKGDVLNLRGRSIRYAILQRDVDTNRALYDALLQRYKEIGVAGGIGTAPVSIVDRADPPAAPFKPRLLLNLLIGLTAGFVAGMATAVALEYLNDTIKSRDDVRDKLGLACLGIVPKRPAKGDFVEDLRDPTSGISEAYSSVAASLGFTTEHGIPKVLLLTSSRPAEGKSSSALALSQNYSRRGKSVLLIDCDLRKPAFRNPGDGGLTKLLTNDDPITTCISATHFENLWLLPSGPIPPNPADLLSTGRFDAIVREAVAQFDHVIIDAPPVIGLADAPLLAAICKNVMFIIEAGKTRTYVAREAISKLQAAGAHILGATLTKSNVRHHVYGYGYGYRYGYGQDFKYGRSLDTNRREIALIPEETDRQA